jgi:hypothetical protein
VFHCWNQAFWIVGFFWVFSEHKFSL